MREFITVARRPFLAVLLFLSLQFAAGVSVMVVRAVSGNGNIGDLFSPDTSVIRIIAVTTLVCDLLMAVGCMVLFRSSVYFRSTYRPLSASWTGNITAMTGCILGTAALDIFGELAEVPDMMMNVMMELCRDPWGVAAIAVAAPVAEELMFRHGIMGHMLRNGCSVRVSLLVSSLLFGLIHINPAQVFFAVPMGVLLGMLYWRSGSVLWPVALHVLNNSVACVQVWVVGDGVGDMALSDVFGGRIAAFAAACVMAVMCAVVMWWYCTVNGRRKAVGLR
ncbi:MAG: CPBP family intramembrane metalloprotease [Bacteroidaceae bacterium]|nr:CPBP family intramembrane metalloprotease [Bacteroidaceae bacterium]